MFLGNTVLQRTLFPCSPCPTPLSPSLAILSHDSGRGCGQLPGSCALHPASLLSCTAPRPLRLSPQELFLPDPPCPVCRCPRRMFRLGEDHTTFLYTHHHSLPHLLRTAVFTVPAPWISGQLVLARVGAGPKALPILQDSGMLMAPQPIDVWSCFLFMSVDLWPLNLGFLVAFCCHLMTVSRWVGEAGTETFL